MNRDVYRNLQVGMIRDRKRLVFEGKLAEPGVIKPFKPKRDAQHLMILPPSIELLARLLEQVDQLLERRIANVPAVARPELSQ